MCDRKEPVRQNADNSAYHPAIRQALAFLLEESYRQGDTKAILILGDAMRQFDTVERGA